MEACTNPRSSFNFANQMLPLFKEQMIVISPIETTLHQDSRSGWEQYVQRAFCEFGDLIDFRDMVDKASEAHGARCEAVYKSDRDDWVLGMVASGFGFGFLPRYLITHDGIIARPLVDPECWRNIHLVTVRDKPQSHIVGVLVNEAMRTD